MAMIDNAELLCERVLTETGGDNTLVVKLGKPRQKSKDEYICHFQIAGLGKSEIKTAYGIDALQALIMALDGIRASLGESGEIFTWQGGSTGDHGVPRFVPAFYGLEFSRKVEQIIDDEIRKFASSAEGNSTSSPGGQ